MEKNADVVITGTLSSHKTELRTDVVFTLNCIKIESIIKTNNNISVDQTIQILQTGGTYDNFTTPAFCDCPLLQYKKEYKLYLKYINKTESYDDYYLILGGYQGVAILENDELTPISDSNNLFNTNNTSNSSKNTRATSSYTPRISDMHYWNKSTLKVLVPSSIAATYKSNTRSGICDGVSSWALCSEAPTVTLQSEAGQGSDVAVSMQNYGNVGWDGQAETTYYVNSKIATSSTIRINVYSYKSADDLNDRIFWKAIAAHEMGHVFGLGHNTDYSVTSVMRPHTTDFYNRYADWPRIATGRDADIYTMNLIY